MLDVPTLRIIVHLFCLFLSLSSSRPEFMFYCQWVSVLYCSSVQSKDVH